QLLAVQTREGAGGWAGEGTGKDRYTHHTPHTRIACPECGAELTDVEGWILAAFPPQIRIDCNECGYVGTRVL
ncbi:MAG TPA: hypothetical protein VMN36_01550, partial [Verrucomicrobiales bacterium]|nr:hypothetical protein [Verrucomicrobiales bacterium]